MTSAAAASTGLAPRRTLSGRLLAYLLPLMALSAVLAFAAVEWTFYRAERAALLEAAERVVRVDGAVLADSLWSIDEARMETVLSSIRANLPFVQSLLLEDGGGKQVGVIGDPSLPAEAPQYRTVAPLHHDGGAGLQPVGQLTLTVHAGGLRDALRAHATTSAVVVVVLLCALAAGVTLATRRVIAEPLAQLRNAIDTSREDATHLQVDWRRNDELGELIEAYNRMQVAKAKTERELARHQNGLERMVERRTRELELARRNAEAAAQAKANFLSTMSHELRTPMNGILGMADLLGTDRLDADERSMLATIKDSGAALLAVINDILDLSKIEAGKLELESLPVSIGNVVEGAAGTLAATASARSLRLITHVATELPSHCLGDSARLRQILFNLVGNAIKFSHEGAAVTVGVDAVEADGGADASSRWLRLCVQDSGIGMSEETVEHLFEPFSQADASTTREFGGTGLGLSICQRLAKAMHGRIEVHSTLGVGTTFRVLLPMLLPPDADSGQDEELYLTGLRAIVIDANQTGRAAAADYLQAAGAAVTTHASWPEGGAPDGDVLVLSDPGTAWPDAPALAAMTLPSARVVAHAPGARGVHPTSTTTQSVRANPLARAELVRAVATACGRETRDAAPVAHRTARGAHAGRLLVAEDNVVNQKVIARQLAMLGHECVVVADGNEALAAWQQDEFDLLLTDCAMPHMDGYALSQAIRAAERGGAARLPIIAVTAHAMEDEAERCRAAGMDDYVAKPVNINDLREKLDQWLACESSSGLRVQT